MRFRNSSQSQSVEKLGVMSPERKEARGPGAVTQRGDDER